MPYGILSSVVLSALAGPQSPNEPQILDAPGPAMGDSYGCALAEGGSYYLAVGNSGEGLDDRGSVHLYSYAPDMGDPDDPYDKHYAWTAEMEAVDVSPGARLGAAVAFSSGYAEYQVVAGAPFDEHAGWSDAGSVRVFEEVLPGSWEPVGVLWSAAPAESAAFGSSLSHFGGCLAVGSPGVAAVDLFEKNSYCCFVNDQVLRADPYDPNDGFGSAVSLGGKSAQEDLLLVGAPRAVVTGIGPGGMAVPNEDAGAAYLFEIDSTSTSRTRLISPDPDPGDAFGSSVAVNAGSGEVWPSFGIAVVGAPGDDEGGVDAGAAYLFVREVGTLVWQLEAKLLAQDPGADDRFGTSVALDFRGEESLLFVGAPGDDDAGNGSGAVHVYERFGPDGAGTWLPRGCAWTAPDAGELDGFGEVVVASGAHQRLLAGAPDKGFFAGGAYVYGFSLLDLPIVGCGAVGSLAVEIADSSTLLGGSKLTAYVHDPQAAFPGGSAFLAVSSELDPSGGKLLPGWGGLNPELPAKLFLDLGATSTIVLGPAAWGGKGPAVLTATLPKELAKSQLFAQGWIAASLPTGFGDMVGLTPALVVAPSP
jgi:hypothetical protein